MNNILSFAIKSFDDKLKNISLKKIDSKYLSDNIVNKNTKIFFIIIFAIFSSTIIGIITNIIYILSGFYTGAIFISFVSKINNNENNNGEIEWIEVKKISTTTFFPLIIMCSKVMTFFFPFLSVVINSISCILIILIMNSQKCKELITNYLSREKNIKINENYVINNANYFIEKTEEFSLKAYILIINIFNKCIPLLDNNNIFIDLDNNICKKK
jgi:hypothetical protein